MHELLREHSMTVYKQMTISGKNTLFENLKKDKKLLKYLTKTQIKDLSDYKNYIGHAAQIAAETAQKIRATVS